MSKWKRHLTRDANILCKYLIMSGLSYGPRYIFSDWTGMHSQLWTWKNKETGIHFLFSEMEYFNDFLEKTVLDDFSLIKKYRDQSRDICDDVVIKIQKSSQSITPTQTTEDIAAAFEIFMKNYQRLGETIIMNTEKMEDRASQKLKDPNELAVITAPAELSLEAQEELDRLNIVEYIKKKYRKLFVGNNLDTIKNNLHSHPELEKKINNHVEKYCWIPLNYEKDLWDMDFFIKLFQSYLKDSYDYTLRINELSRHSEKVLEERKKILATAEVETKTLAAILEARTFVRLYRANIFSKAFYAAFPLLKEIGRRTYIPITLLKYFTPPEIVDALRNQKELSAKQATARKQAFVMIIKNDKFNQYEGKKAEAIIKREYPEEKIRPTTTLHGQCAFPGKVAGRVKHVFDALEMSKINQGDILVCNATNPDLIIAMGKAAAIVTEEGGITSHAAIVSREMKKPCIIGTKIATKVLKDGDKVEVDANKGVVRKLSRH